MYRIKSIYATVTSCILIGCSLTSCGGEEVQDTTVAIDFAATASPGVQVPASRGPIKSAGTDVWSNGDVICVNAIYYRNPNNDLGEQFMYNNAVTAAVTPAAGGNPAVTTWSYSPVKYWPQQGVVDFYAVSPYAVVSDAMLSNLILYHRERHDRVINAHYDLRAPQKPMPATAADAGTYSDATLQPDLMFAHAPDLSKPGVNDRVNFSFTHAAMAVRFWLGTAKLEGRYTNLHINRVALLDIIPSGYVTAYSLAGSSDNPRLRYEWDYTSERIRSTYVQSIDNDKGLWVTTNTGSGEVTLNRLINPEERIFVIPPQTFTPATGASIAIDYSYTSSANELVQRRSIFHVEHVPAAGQILDIYLNFAFTAIEATVKVSDWTTIESAVINAD